MAITAAMVKELRELTGADEDVSDPYRFWIKGGHYGRCDTKGSSGKCQIRSGCGCGCP